LKLEISLPHEDKPLVAKGKVVWVEKLTIISAESYVSYDCGVEFVDIAPQDLESINRHIMFNIRQGEPDQGEMKSPIRNPRSGE
jgi:hypothetical protein